MLLAFIIACLSAKSLVSAEANARAPEEDACALIADAVSSASLVSYPRQYFFFLFLNVQRICVVVLQRTLSIPRTYDIGR